jgi:hypothetical protein
MESVIELKPFGEFWQVTNNGSVLVCAVARQGAINAAALLRHQLNDPVIVDTLKFVGLELAELFAVPRPNWKQKGPFVNACKHPMKLAFEDRSTCSP